MLHTISNKQIRVDFDDSVGEVCALDFEGIAILKAPTYGSWPKSWPVMFPICGKLKDDKYVHEGKTYQLPGHGFFRSLKWDVTVAPDQLSLHAEATNCDSFLAVYPFLFGISLNISVSGNEFSYGVRVQNKGDRPMYFNSGHHGAFLVDPKAYSIVLPKAATFVKYMAKGGTGPSLGPVAIIGSEALDFDSECSYQTIDPGVRSAVLHSGRGYVARMVFDAFNVFTLWSKPHSDWVCLEPWNGNQDVGNESSYELAHKPLIKSIPPHQHYEDVLKITYARE